MALTLLDLLQLVPPFTFEVSTDIPPIVSIDTGVRSETYKSVFGGLYSKIKGIFPSNPANVTYLLETSSLPYISISKLSNVLDSKYSCFTRLEKALYQINCYTEDLDELNRKLDAVELVLDYSTFVLDEPRLLTNLCWEGRKVKEIYPNIYMGYLMYEVLIQKSLSTDNLLINIEGNNLFEGINLRYKRFLDYPFITTNYQLENTKLPYIVIPQILTRENQRNTKARFENNRFSFNIVSEDLDELEVIQDEICNVFDYCKMNINNRRFMVFEWLSDSVIEIYPGLWQGSVDYELLTEKDII